MVVSLLDIVREPLGLNKLREMLPSSSKAVLYSTLTKNKRSRQEIFKGILSMVVLYETKIDGKRQGHWVVLIPRAHSIEYFSSLGRSPSDEMNALHQDKSAFNRILGKNFTYNRSKLQLQRYDVDDCGYWALARAILVDVKLRDFQKLFRGRTVSSSDEMMGLMTLLLANR
jgi:hypothetical protein